MTDRPEDRPEFPHDTRLFQGGFDPGDLDFAGGDSLWTRVEELCADDGPAEHLDAAMDGMAAPRTWLIVHPPGRGELSAAVALAFARELASRDQSALVLDADEADSALTGWIGRREAEGWIDLARYGTSVLTSGINLPFEGRRGYVLGVGSFTPTDVTDEEISALMARLRRQADDVLVVAPADALGAAWASAAGVRLLCWDPETTSRVEADELAGHFEQAGQTLTGVIAFGDLPASGLAASEERLVEEVLAESIEPEEETPDHEGFDDGPPPTVPVAGQDDPVDAEDTDRGSAPLGPGIYGEGDEPKQGSSKIFWVGAVVAVLVIAVAFVYYFKVLKVPSEGHFENVPVATRTQPAPAGGSSVGSDDSESGSESATGAMDSLAALAEGEAATDADTMALPDQEVVQESETAVVEPDPAVDPAADPPAEDRAVAGSTPEESVTAQLIGFDMTPYETPVGENGWALHVYSLPTMESLQAELKELDRRKFRTAVKAVDVPEKGRWYRVFLGNFASRAEANASKQALLDELGVDYAAAKKFESSSLDLMPE